MGRGTYSRKGEAAAGKGEAVIGVVKLQLDETSDFVLFGLNPEFNSLIS